MRIDIRSPHPGETLRNKIDMAPLAGVAIAGERPSTFDVIVVIDVSGSSAYPSGIDVDNDGVLGETRRSPISSEPDVPNTDPDDPTHSLRDACWSAVNPEGSPLSKCVVAVSEADAVTKCQDLCNEYREAMEMECANDVE